MYVSVSVYVCVYFVYFSFLLFCLRQSLTLQFKLASESPCIQLALNFCSFCLSLPSSEITHMLPPTHRHIQILVLNNILLLYIFCLYNNSARFFVADWNSPCFTLWPEPQFLKHVSGHCLLFIRIALRAWHGLYHLQTWTAEQQSLPEDSHKTGWVNIPL